jgi:hypothetical protein
LVAGGLYIREFYPHPDAYPHTHPCTGYSAPAHHPLLDAYPTRITYYHAYAAPYGDPIYHTRAVRHANGRSTPLNTGGPVQPALAGPVVLRR